MQVSGDVVPVENPLKAAAEELCGDVVADMDEAVLDTETDLRKLAVELCDALAERWFAHDADLPGELRVWDLDAKIARCVLAHRRLSDLLMMNNN